MCPLFCTLNKEKYVYGYALLLFGVRIPRIFRYEPNMLVFQNCTGRVSGPCHANMVLKADAAFFVLFR
ncbi:MAG: hypothetical protein CSA22_10110 [Deltaproteobacteria bacterium]|nr:MAG: hypothetical protein CSA22_10110 [Deltaproteobacteria bacterium]